MHKEVRGPAAATVTFCVCQKRQYGVMTQCELCKDWFHGRFTFIWTTTCNQIEISILSI